MAEANASPEAVRKLAELIKGIHVAMLTTITPDGTLRSRPMSTQDAPFDGELWFLTEAESGKTADVFADQHVNLCYADPDAGQYVSVSGIATVVRDAKRARELWSPLHKVWFAGGPDDPNLALLKVVVTQAEYWDGSGGRMVQIAGFIKAIVTGRRYEPGGYQKIDFATRPEPPKGEDWPKGEGRAAEPAPGETPAQHQTRMP